jgi:hypothetical protein
MPIERLRARHLSPEERADLESVLKDPERFRVEDRRTFVMGMIGLAWFALLAEIGVMLECKKCPWKYEDALEHLEGFFSSLPWSLQFLWHPEVLPLIASNVLLLVVVAAVVIIIQALRARKRQGHALTSFGVVRIRGNSLRLLRYAEIAETRVSQSFADVLEVLDTEGNCLVVDGGAEWKPLIDARRSPPADSGAKPALRHAADTDGKRSA